MSDGVNWQNHGLPGFVGEEMINTETGLTLHSSNNQLIGRIWSVDGGANLGTFSSTNGLDWQPADPSSIGLPVENRPTQAEYPGVQKTNFGYIDVDSREISEEESVDIFWNSLDGTTWEEVESAPLLEPSDVDGVGGASKGGIGDLIFAGYGGEGAAIFVGHFER